ncbi:GbsR/MarR family transcriptional regulator [Cellvibrio japonicus]|nr:GbsR/MarR family transcriptional regulator [Cellvibrio japonicus]QEI17858.1 GbsR/MarR family transcriptional regulator [Cellvibrio japonicus]QEI21433.1 GbsR/MarR family transcriptional regulator [Cellvibrio japonicus]
MTLTPMIQSCVLHFGEMGSRWGINRTVGQMYALLVLSKEPLCADDITEALGISRSNVSMGLKELTSWELVKLQHRPGERKEYYSAPGDVWDIAKTLIEQRRKREMDPTLTALRNLLIETPANPEEAYAQQRMRDMHELIEMITLWTTEIQRMDSANLSKLLKLGNSLGKVLDFKDRLLGTGKRSQAKNPCPNTHTVPGDAPSAHLSHVNVPCCE